MNWHRSVAAVLIAGLIMAAPALAGQMFKCVAGDRVVYQDLPCPGGRSIVPPPPPNPAEQRAALDRAERDKAEARQTELREDAERRLAAKRLEDAAKAERKTSLAKRSHNQRCQEWQTAWHKAARQSHDARTHRQAERYRLRYQHNCS